MRFVYVCSKQGCLMPTRVLSSDSTPQKCCDSRRMMCRKIGVSGEISGGPLLRDHEIWVCTQCPGPPVRESLSGYEGSRHCSHKFFIYARESL